MALWEGATSSGCRRGFRSAPRDPKSPRLCPYRKTVLRQRRFLRRRGFSCCARARGSATLPGVIVPAGTTWCGPCETPGPQQVSQGQLRSVRLGALGVRGDETPCAGQRLGPVRELVSAARTRTGSDCIRIRRLSPPNSPHPATHQASLGESPLERSKHRSATNERCRITAVAAWAVPLASIRGDQYGKGERSARLRPRATLIASQGPAPCSDRGRRVVVPARSPTGTEGAHEQVGGVMLAVSAGTGLVWGMGSDLLELRRRQGGGGASVIAPDYIAEISPENARGQLGSRRVGDGWPLRCTDRRRLARRHGRRRCGPCGSVSRLARGCSWSVIPAVIMGGCARFRSRAHLVAKGDKPVPPRCCAK